MRNSLFLSLLKNLTVRAELPLFLLATGAVAMAAPKYIQGNYAVPQTPQTSVTVPYSSAQTAGDLNVVVVGWNDSATHVGSLKDSKGNVYQLAVGPTVTGVLSQSIYYAKNIAGASAAANVVTVTFSGSASYPDIRILEYSGIDPVNPVDTFAGAIGNSATSANVTLKTTAAADLLVAGNTVQSSSNAGSGFTLRLKTSPDGDIAEDETATSAGTYSASATLASTSGWVMQAVAFRAAGSPSPTPTPTPTPGTPAYVQGNYAVPQTAQTTVTVPYTAAQTAGDLNLAIVGWSSTSAKVSSLTDSSGNVYQLAIGPTVGTGGLSQSIYYAKNILAAKAGANAVKLTFNAAAANPDIRILEYRGIATASPVDVAIGATSSSASSSSGAVTTKNAVDLLVAANTVQTATTGAGSGFTKRLLTNPDGDIAEDQVVKVVGSYNAVAPVAPSGAWVMQMVALKAASGSASAPSGSLSTPTPAPTPTPKPTATPKATPTPTPTPSPTPGSKNVTLAWNANTPTNNAATNTIGYRLKLGHASKTYTQTTTLGNVTTVTVSSLVSGTTYYFAVTAYDSAGLDSPVSNEIVYKAP